MSPIFQQSAMMTFNPLWVLLLIASLLGYDDGPDTYAQRCSTPPSHWVTPPDGWHNPILNRVKIDREDRLIWNGRTISGEHLRDYLSIIRQMEPMPATVLTVDPQAGCATVQAVRLEMERRLQCQQTRACGEGEGGWRVGPNLPRPEDMTPEQRGATRALEDEADRVEEGTGSPKQ